MFKILVRNEVTGIYEDSLVTGSPDGTETPLRFPSWNCAMNYIRHDLVNMPEVSRDDYRIENA